jgi:putative transposase
MIRAHKIRLHPTAEQASYFARAAGTARFVFNWGLEHWIKGYQSGQQSTALGLKKAFNAIKAEQFPWVYDVTKCAVEGAFMDLGAAFQRFFEGRAAGRKVGYPKFKTKKGSKASFYLANDKFTVGDHWLDVPKLGRVNMAETLRFKGKILSARISKRAQWWFVSISVEVPDGQHLNQHPAVGVDVGLLRLATLSDGRRYENQAPLKPLLNKLRRVQRKLNRQQRGSHNYEKTRLKLARLHYRIACRRDDVLHKLTTDIARTSGLVGVEDLHVKGLLQNRHLARAFSDAALGRLLDLLDSKVRAAGGQVVKVGRFFPSSQRCSVCHALKRDMTLADRQFFCPHCGFAADRDFNASLNILHEAVRLYREQPVAVVATTRR